MKPWCRYGNPVPVPVSVPVMPHLPALVSYICTNSLIYQGKTSFDQARSDHARWLLSVAVWLLTIMPILRSWGVGGFRDIHVLRISSAPSDVKSYQIVRTMLPLYTTV